MPSIEPQATVSKQELAPQTPRWERWAIACALIGLVVRAYLLVATRYTAEDFYITLRYSENLAGGQGMVFNPGERVLGTTTPLYCLWLAFWHWAGGNAPLIGKLTNLFADACVPWLIFQCARTMGRGGVGVLAGALYALSPPSLTWSISGMETGLVTACGLAGFVAGAQGKTRRTGLLAGLCILLRADGLILAAATLGSLWIATRRVPIRPALICLAIAAPWWLFAWGYFGSMIAQTAVAKVTVYGWQAKSQLPNVVPFLAQMTHSLPHKALFALAILGGLTQLRRNRQLWSPVGWMTAHYGAMALSPVFLFGWYFVPPSPLYYLLAALGLVWIANLTLIRINLGVGPWAGSVGLLLVLLAGAKSLPTVKATLSSEQAKEERIRKAIGLELRTTIPQGERLMLEPIGYVGYFSRVRVLDTVGLVSPEVLQFYRRGVRSPYRDMLDRLKPEWALLRAGELEDLVQSGGIPNAYGVVKAFADPSDSNQIPLFTLLRRADSQSAGTIHSEVKQPKSSSPRPSAQ